MVVCDYCFPVVYVFTGVRDIFYNGNGCFERAEERTFNGA